MYQPVKLCIEVVPQDMKGVEQLYQHCDWSIQTQEQIHGWWHNATLTILGDHDFLVNPQMLKIQMWSNVHIKHCVADKLKLEEDCGDSLGNIYCRSQPTALHPTQWRGWLRRSAGPLYCGRECRSLYGWWWLRAPINHKLDKDSYAAVLPSQYIHQNTSNRGREIEKVWITKTQESPDWFHFSVLCK